MVPHVPRPVQIPHRDVLLRGVALDAPVPLQGVHEVEEEDRLGLAYEVALGGGLGGAEVLVGGQGVEVRGRQPREVVVVAQLVQLVQAERADGDDLAVVLDGADDVG